MGLLEVFDVHLQAFFLPLVWFLSQMSVCLFFLAWDK